MKRREEGYFGKIIIKIAILGKRKRGRPYLVKEREKRKRGDDWSKEGR